MKRTLKAPKSGVRAKVPTTRASLLRKRPRYEEESSYSEDEEGNEDNEDNDEDSEYVLGASPGDAQRRGRSSSEQEEESERESSAGEAEDAIILSDNEGNVETHKRLKSSPKETPIKAQRPKVQ